MATKELIKLENVYFFYTCINAPQFKYESKVEKEFKVTIVVSKEEAKSFKKRKINKVVKEIDTSEFETKFKAAPPFPDQDEQYLINLTRNATYKDGNPTPEWTYPKTYLEVDGALVLATETLVGNGSFGDIRFEVEEGKNGLSARLHSILVKKHIAVEKRGDEWAVAVDSKTGTGLDTSTRSNPAKMNNDIFDQAPTELDNDLPF